MRRSGGHSKGGPQTMAEEAMVHPRASERRVCLAYGGRARSLRRALRPEVSGCVLRRDALPDGGRDAHSFAPKARASGALRLRVRTQGDGQLLRLLRAQAGMATSGCHRAAHGGGLRPCHAAFDRRALPRGRKGAGGPRQPQYSYPSLALQGIRAAGGAAPLASVGVPSHAQTRLLAQPGGDRALDTLSAVPQSPHPGREYAKEGERSMAKRAKQTGGDGFVAFQRSRRSGEAQATLPTTIIEAEY